jgi:hypothetical protein
MHLNDPLLCWFLQVTFPPWTGKTMLQVDQRSMCKVSGGFLTRSPILMNIEVPSRRKMLVLRAAVVVLNLIRGHSSMHKV